MAFNPWSLPARASSFFNFGLAICLDIVRRHGGDISVQSSADDGSIFRVVLPITFPMNRAWDI